MAHPSRYPDSAGDTGDDTGVGPDHGSAAGTPRWVKALGIIVLVLVLLFVILLLTRGPGGRGHGPGNHAPSSSAMASGGHGGLDPSECGR